MFLRISYCALVLIMSSVFAVAQGTKYEAENGTPGGTLIVQAPYRLSTPAPQNETLRLWNYITDSFTHKIHSGAMSLNAKEEAEWLFTQTGKYPALIGLDLMNHNRNYSWYDESALIR